MSQEPKKANWQPTASADAMEQRAQLYRSIRQFFDARQMLEVETPLIGAHFTSEPNILGLCVHTQTSTNPIGYLQSSPEHHMKRLLANGARDIYQICKAFRSAETGYKHNQEFSMLEWYRVGWNYLDLAQEVTALLSDTLNAPTPNEQSYERAFQRATGLNPHTATIHALKAFATQHIELNDPNQLPEDKSTWLDLIFSHCVETQFNPNKPTVLYEFPEAQSALAETKQTAMGYEVALRFEVFYKGVELANGYQELRCPTTLENRFRNHHQQLKNAHGITRSPDNFLLGAQTRGLPVCAGVAMGLDRLLMIKTNAKHIAHVLTFTQDNA